MTTIIDIVSSNNKRSHEVGISNNTFLLEIRDAIENDETENEILELIEKQPSTVFATPDEGNNLPIHIVATQTSSVKVMEEVIRKYPEGLRKKNDDGRLPVHLAAKYNISVDVLKVVLDAYPAGIKERNNYGWLPIHCSTVSGVSFTIVQQLLEYYPDGVKQLTKNDMLPLHFAARSSNCVEIVRAILRAYPDGAKQRDATGQLPLHFSAASSSCKEVVEEVRFSSLWIIVLVLVSLFSFPVHNRFCKRSLWPVRRQTDMAACRCTWPR